MEFFSALPAGYLPKWLFFISAVSLFNSAQTFTSGLDLTRRVYARQPGQVTPLSARTFGTWTLITAIVRLYGAMYTNIPAIYNLTMATFYVAFFHFGLELFVFRTAKLGSGTAGPLIVSTLSIAWMTMQKGFYLL